MKSLTFFSIKLCFLVLILFGIYEFYPYCFVSIKALEGKLSIDMSYPAVKKGLFIRGLLSLFSLLFGTLLIVSGIGVYNLKNWARKLALFLLSLELLLRSFYLFIIYFELDFSLNIEVIIAIFFCLLIITLLSLKSAKNAFK